ncbi:MAG: translation initiation factor 2 [Pseudomonadota bacterium]
MKQQSLAVLTILLATTGCATVFQGTKDKVYFESVPEGARATAERITENDESPVSCVTPCSMKLSRKRDFRVTFELEGYKPAVGKLSSKLDGGGAAGFVGNAVLGGGIGAIVDAGTGATHDLFPNPITAQLSAVGSSQPSRVLDEPEPVTSDTDE